MSSSQALDVAMHNNTVVAHHLYDSWGPVAGFYGLTRQKSVQELEIER
jgi:hypothetical protein